MASALSGAPASFVSADVALGSEEPVVGSFTADGLTYAVGSDELALVAIDPAAASDGAAAVPASVSYDGVDYPVTAIGPYAFYLSGATDVALPASVSSVDDRALRSCDVERVEVAVDNLSYASFDGCLYSSQLTRLLLIPGGRKGAVRIPDKAEGVDAPAFSHCAGVGAISVDAGSAHLSSWDGLLYDASGTTLLRVPAGATDIAIREGCTTIASGAMAGCANLERINAPASVASISPNAFEDVPTVSLPAQSALQGEATSSVASSLLDQTKEPTGSAPQLTAMVALASVTDDAPRADPSSMTVTLPQDSDASAWEALKFAVELSDQHALADLLSAETYSASYIGRCTLYANASDAYLQKMGGWSGTATSISADMYGNCVIDGGLGVMIVAWFDAQGTWTGVQPYRPGYRCSGWNGTFNFAWGPGAQFSPTGSFTEYAQWQANNYTIAFDANGGSGNVPANVSATYDQSHYVAAPTLSKPGYTFDGWATTPGGAKAYEKGGPFKNLTTAVDGTVTLYAHWRENSLKVDANGGELIKQGAWPAGPSTVPSVSTRFNDGWQIEPTVMQVSWWNTDGQWTAVQPTRVGYACTGYAGSVGFTAGQEAISDTAPLDIKALWRACDYALIIRANGGSIDGSSDDLALTVTYDSAANSSLSCRFARTGYAFKGAYTEATGGTQVFGPSGNCTREGTYWSNSSLWCYPGNATLYAQWDPVLSADVPLEVTARVDKLGIEEQAPAAGYIESRCGEPLKVTDVSFAPLPGASELFGAGNESQVRLQALAGQGATWQPGGANASFSFPLDASATESDAGKLAVLTMQAYGERIPISYRFDVPDALLATLAEATTTVCQVAYTVALA